MQSMYAEGTYDSGCNDETLTTQAKIHTRTDHSYILGEDIDTNSTDNDSEPRTSRQRTIYDQSSLPKLACMAFDLLSIPATSCEVDHVFSRSKFIILTQRHRMKDETLELLVCLKDWLLRRSLD